MRISPISQNIYPKKVEAKNSTALIGSSMPIYNQMNNLSQVPKNYLHISFGANNQLKKTEAELYKNMGILLDDTVQDARDDVGNGEAAESEKSAVPQNVIDLSGLSLNQKLILKKYTANDNLKTLLDMPKKGALNDAIIQSLFRKEVMLSQRYENQTFGKFSDPNATNDEKLKAFATALVFLSMSMKKASPAELKETLKNIAEFKSATNTAIDEDDADKNRTQTKNLFDTAKQYWSKKHLPELMDEEIKKMIFIEQALNENSTLQELKTFKDLPIDEKYFVAQYFENQKGAHHHDDPMVDILTNRTIPDITAVIQEMQKKVSVDESAFFGEINNVFDTIQDEEGIERLAHFNVSGRNSDDNMSLLNLYLMILGKGELTEETDHSKILEFFSSVSKADIEDANKMLKEGWRDTILPAKVDKEAAFKAYETDADTQIIKELEKINENLGKIVIKLDDISISLHQLVANVDRIYAKFDNPVQKSEELQQKNRLYVEAMKSGVDNLSPEESKKVLEAFKTDGIRYLDVLLEKTTSPENKKAINDIKQTIYRANNPSTVVARLEGYAPILVMNQAMNLGRKAVTHAAKEQAAGGTAAMSGTSIAATAGIAAVVVAMYGIYKASVVHKEFTDLYFGE